MTSALFNCCALQVVAKEDGVRQATTTVQMASNPVVRAVPAPIEVRRSVSLTRSLCPTLNRGHTTGISRYIILVRTVLGLHLLPRSPAVCTRAVSVASPFGG